MGGLVDCFTYPLACCHRAAVTTRHVFSSLADQTRSLRLKVQKKMAQAGALATRCKGLVRLDARSVLLFCSRRLERGQEQTALTEAPLRFRKESDFRFKKRNRVKELKKQKKTKHNTRKISDRNKKPEKNKKKQNTIPDKYETKNRKPEKNKKKPEKTRKKTRKNQKKTKKTRKNTTELHL